jgi:acetylglutamate kinase
VQLTKLLAQMGKKSEFVSGLRITDAETRDAALMVLGGRVNKSLVALLGSKGGRAVGLSGIDDRLIEARCKDERLGFVGEITRINPEAVTDLIERGYIPVISTVASGIDGQTYNINGDTAAACIAGALRAERLIMMTDIAGILRDPKDPATLISEISVSEASKLFHEGVISGGMIPKVECCIRAIEEGVRKVTIMDGRVPHAILMELLTNEGAGTMVSQRGGR